MVLDPGPSLRSSEALAARGVAGDVASVAGMWAVAALDDLRRAGPDRAAQVRRILESYVLPWLVPRTGTVGDISYVMVHEWLLMLVGRWPGDPDECDPGPALVAVSRAARERSLRETAEAAGVSLATARRSWRYGELLGAYPDVRGHVRVPETTVAALRSAKQRRRSTVLSQPVAADALWVLRRSSPSHERTRSCHLGWIRPTGLRPRDRMRQSPALDDPLRSPGR